MSARSYRVYPGPFPKPPPGMCRWCGLLIKKDGLIDHTQIYCGPICKTHFQLRADPQKMRLHVFFRDGGKCADCGTTHADADGEWEADHVKPLMIAFGDPDAWEPDNVVLLCTKPCHVNKSRRDRREFRQRFRRKAKSILDAIT